MSKRFFPFALTRHDHRYQQHALRLFVPSATAMEVVPDDDTTPIDQQLADSFNANNAILTYVVAMENTNLPVVNAPWFSTFSASFSDAKTHAMSWYDTISPGLVSIPTGIANFGIAFSLNMNTISAYVNILQNDPGNPQALAALQRSLRSLLSAIQSQQTGVSNFQATLNGFSATLTADQAVMQAAVTSAQNQQGVDQAQVAALTAAISALQADIAKWNTVITAVGIAGVLSIFIGCVASIFSFGLGLLFAVASTIATITTILVAQKNIRDDNAAILQTQATIGTLNAEIAGLIALQTNLNNLVSLSSQAQQQFQLILEAWGTLETEITAVVNDLGNAALDVATLSALVSDLSAANADWQVLMQFCNTLKGIQYTVLPGVTAIPIAA